MKNRHLLAAFSAVLTGCIGITTSVQAENWTDHINISGFGSAVAQITDEDAFFNGEGNEEGVNKDGSFQGTKIGLNINANISDQLTIVSQLFAEASEEYEAHIDWAFASFRLSDEVTLSAGKLKYPVGLVNEYRDVGYAYPWLAAPYVIYTELETVDAMGSTRTAPNVIREAYSGIGLAWDKLIGDWTWGVILFVGSASLENADMKKLRGLTINLDWDDTVRFTAASYTGTMRNIEPFRANATTGLPEPNPMTAMNGKDHSVTLVGVTADWNNVVIYTEAAQVEMQNLKPMSNDVWYATLGYRFGKWLPHYTHQNFENDLPATDARHTEYSIDSLGLRYELMKSTALKFDISRIDQKDGNGLFTGTITNTDLEVMKYAIGVDYVF